MKFVLGLAALIALVIVIGALLPKRHVASRSAVIHHDQQAVYDAIRDVANALAWRSDVTGVDILSPSRFRERGKHGAVTYDVVTDDPPRTLMTRIADTNLGYGGSWTYALESVADGTRVTITEDGEVSNVIFRFMSRFVFGHTATIDKYLAALQNRQSWPQPKARLLSGR